MNPRPQPVPSLPTTVARDASPHDIASAALAQPPPTSSPRDHRLLLAAHEAGVSGQALSVLEHIDIAGLDAHDRITYLQILTAHAAWLEAMHAIAVAAVAGPSGGWVEAEIEASVSRDVAELSPSNSTPREREHIAAQARDEAWEVRERAIALEVSMAMRVSPRTAGRRIHGARLLLEHLRPAVTESLAGRWGYGHLRVVEKELADIPEPLRNDVFGDLLPHAATDHPRRLTERIRKSLARRDAAGSAERMRERAKARDVALWNLPDGQARLVITGPYATVTKVHRVLTDMAKAHRHVVLAAAQAEGAGTDPAQTERRLGVLRFDALVEAVTRMECDMHGVGRHFVHTAAEGLEGNLAERPTDPSSTHDVTQPYTDPWTGPPVHAPGSNPTPAAAIIVDVATALGMADEPGYLPGYGWVPAPIAREILADTDKWRRWLIDDSSRKVIEAGSVRYRPSQALRDLVSGRDLTCTADTCTRPASNSQLDHAVDFDGSNTTPDNVHAVCGPDHLVVTAGHFLIDADEAGHISWVSTASGHSYPSHPDLLHEQPVKSVE
ncbi:MAG: DUF222 domain-containing protein [Actinomycetota bacterium]